MFAGTSSVNCAGTAVASVVEMPIGRSATTPTLTNVTLAGDVTLTVMSCPGWITAVGAGELIWRVACAEAVVGRPETISNAPISNRSRISSRLTQALLWWTARVKVIELSGRGHAASRATRAVNDRDRRRWPEMLKLQPLF